jgi:predicted RNA-binding Zn-ribbon protein involved in translation (DUF1610 family)
VQKVFIAAERTFIESGKPSVQESLSITEVTPEREVERECPNSGDRKQSCLLAPEKHICPFCGIEYDKDGPYDHRDPQWYYTHPRVVRKMTEVTVTAVLGISK